MLINLLTNAIKYTDRGHVELRVQPTRSTATMVSLRFQVEDTGCGVDETHRKSIFESYTQGLKIGSGLGLPFASFALLTF